MRDQAKAWRVRAFALAKTLNRDANIDTNRFVDLLNANILNKYSDDFGSGNDDSDSGDSYHR